VAFARIGALAKVVSEVLELLQEVRGGKTGDRRVFRTALAVDQMTETAAPDVWSFSILDDVRHLRMIVWKPVADVEAVADLLPRHFPRAAGYGVLLGVGRGRRAAAAGGRRRWRRSRWRRWRREPVRPWRGWIRCRAQPCSGARANDPEQQNS